MIELPALAHLQKYFDLACRHFIEGDVALAMFFAITAIEETAKIMILKGNFTGERDFKGRARDALNHQQKHFSAIINLLDQSPQFETLPQEWQDEVWSWIGADGLPRMRNDSLYIRFNKKGQLFIPEQAVEGKRVPLLVYMAGVALATLDDYITGVPASWANSISQAAQEFRRQCLEVPSEH